MKNLCLSINNKALKQYNIYNELECGIILYNTDIQFLKLHSIDLSHAYIAFKNHEMFFVGFKNPFVTKKCFFDIKSRKIIAKKKDIFKMYNEYKKKINILPIKLLLKKHLIKIIIGCAKVKKKLTTKKF